MLNDDGTISNPNNPRPQTRGSGYAVYDAQQTPSVECSALADRNQRYFNIGGEHGAQAKTTVDLACHHVIGWDILAEFWNALIRERHFNGARDWLGVYGIPKAATGRFEHHIQAATFVSFADQLGPLEARLCWNPLNIVRGPRDRSDDPNKAKGRQRIDFSVAPAGIYQGRVARLVEAGNHMCDYSQSSQTAKADAAIRILASQRGKSIMEWDETLWGVDSNYPGYARTRSPKGGFNVRVPQWRIYTKAKK
ncbi:MAG: hypothetical protein ABW321_20465 [Polyangiales bacterium]